MKESRGEAVAQSGRDGLTMLFSGFAGFHGLLIARSRAGKTGKDVIKQALRRKTGGAHHEHSAMLFRTFAGYIKGRPHMTIQRFGQCVCGSIRYVCTGEPERVTICHCRWCQRRTGTAFGAEVVFHEKNVSFAGLALSSYRHTSDESGRWLEVYFCPRCGSNLGFTLEAVPGVRTIPAGTFDDPAFLDAKSVKVRHVFTRSRRGWSDLTSEVEVYERHFRPQ